MIDNSASAESSDGIYVGTRQPARVWWPRSVIYFGSGQEQVSFPPLRDVAVRPDTGFPAVSLTAKDGTLWRIGEGPLVDVDDARTIGWLLWRVRDDRGKSLRVIAGLAGMSKDTLSRIERGERSPTLSEVRALADALQISVSELTRLPVPAPANGHTDSTMERLIGQQHEHRDTTGLL